jgi:hypothetical protein
MTASAITLAAALARVRDYLVDAGGLVWTDGTITEGIRQALGDVSRASGAKLTLTGLDSAAATTLDALDEDLLVRGAAGYAARSRAIDRAEMANLNQNTAPGLQDWSKNQLEWFAEGVRTVRLRVLQRSASSPASAWTWDEDGEKAW